MAFPASQDNSPLNPLINDIEYRVSSPNYTTLRRILHACPWHYLGSTLKIFHIWSQELPTSRYATIPTNHVLFYWHEEGVDGLAAPVRWSPLRDSSATAPRSSSSISISLIPLLWPSLAQENLVLDPFWGFIVVIGVFGFGGLLLFDPTSSGPIGLTGLKLKSYLLVHSASRPTSDSMCLC